MSRIGHPRAKKRFGQHFLTDPGVIDAIVRAIAPTGDDVIVEIGPGPGAITAPIIKRCGRFHAIELDRGLAASLRERFAADAHVTIHEADALTFDFSALGSALRVIGNLPYNISTPILFHLLEHRAVITDMHFMLQKEVVDRMAAKPGSKAYGRLSIMLGCFLDVEALFDVDRFAFEPPPDVTSAVVRLTPRPEGQVQISDPGLLSKIVAAAFSKRRKTLRNALKQVATEEDLEYLQIDPQLRPENVSVADWVALANHLAMDTDIPR
ncbi:MAG: 16S rRNA (adenine(1518)-N(6)/adenine(1519)-N(6))-dimethyltransferase RsmA [Gammaproteobacteria bacterium]|nr:16S rRNA (adenine(1518)-N(6)/adenine(1519)-N(6))-dimethyltransferase RsmA [Gammaproteobacteria bacterium]